MLPELHHPLFTNTRTDPRPSPYVWNHLKRTQCLECHIKPWRREALVAVLPELLLHLRQCHQLSGWKESLHFPWQSPVNMAPRLKGPPTVVSSRLINNRNSAAATRFEVLAVQEFKNQLQQREHFGTKIEGASGVEPETSRAAVKRSTTELHALLRKNTHYQ